jgi:hypothetical protein
MNVERADTFRERVNAVSACLRAQRPVTLSRVCDIPEALESEREEFLECHARRYVIDHILAGLGWQIPALMDFAAHSQNLQIEIGVTSTMTGHRRFLDYLGTERESGTPLLVVEAKRPSARLPCDPNLGAHYTSHPASELFAKYLQSRHDLQETLDTVLTSEWRGYLDDLRDYVRSVANSSAIPRRAVITNGNWLVLFVDPNQAFIDGNPSVSHAAIFVFANLESIVQHYAAVFEQISYVSLAVHVGLVQPRQLSALISATDITYAMFGQRVLYCKDRKLFAQVPRIELTPVVHLCTVGGGFISVESSNRCEYEMVLNRDDQNNDLRGAIAHSAAALKQEIEDELGVLEAIPLRDITAHYEDKNAFANLPGVRRVPGGTAVAEEFILVTGTSPHFLTDPVAHNDCPYHDSNLSHKHGVLHSLGGLLDPSVEPRAFFQSGSCFHCSHRQTQESKAITLTPMSRRRIGQRSGKNNEPFCELFQLDRVLCCQTCAFHACCSRSELFQLPCLHSRGT